MLLNRYRPDNDNAIPYMSSDGTIKCKKSELKKKTKNNSKFRSPTLEQTILVRVKKLFM